MLFHTSELRHPTARSLHAAWLELEDTRLGMPPTVAEQLAPTSAGAIHTGTNLAATLLEHRRAHGPVPSDSRLAEEAWWWTVWNDPDSPYVALPLLPSHADRVRALLDEIDPRGFPGCRPDEIGRNPEARILCETIAVDEWLCLQTDMQFVDHVEVNRWALECGHIPAGRRLVYDTDMSLIEWSYKRDGIHRLLQAGLLACWPEDDSAPAAEVLRRTRHEIGSMMLAGRLPQTSRRLLNCLRTHPDAIGLVDQTRKLLPSRTVEAERRHPRRHAAPPVPAQAPEPEEEPNELTDDTATREHGSD